MDSAEQHKDASIDDLAKKLKSSPMFQLSLSSLELFHSNFLAWLFETHPSSVEILGIEPPVSCKVDREQKHIDLSIEGDNHKLAVIENKVKSLPDRAQLERYDKTANDYKHKILLTLMPANFSNESKGVWEELTYQMLSERLKEWYIKENNLSPRDRVFIREYQDMISTLSELVSRYFTPDKSYWFEIENSKSLTDIRFIDTINKYYGQQLGRDLIKKINTDASLNTLPLNNEKLKENQIGIFVDVHFFRKSPCVSVYAKKGGINYFYAIQIQGHQYRRMFESKWSDKNKKGEERKSAIKDHISSTGMHGWLFSAVPPKKGEIKSLLVNRWHEDCDAVPYKTTMADLFNAYYPSAVYQHIEISSGSETDENKEKCEKVGVKLLQHCDVIDRAIQDLKYAIQVLSIETSISTGR